jgi:hypothetical protein
MSRHPPPNTLRAKLVEKEEEKEYPQSPIANSSQALVCVSVLRKHNEIFIAKRTVI